MFKFHREGAAIIKNTLLLLGVLNLGVIIFLIHYKILVVSVVIISFILLVLILQFFRNPKREASKGDKYVLCPADGTVVAIEETLEEEYFKDKRIQISIFMSPFNVHANWYPVSGNIKYVKYHKGKKLVAWHPKSSTENERTTIVIAKENKIELLVRQIAGALANRIIYYPHVGDMVRQGAELGFIKFGSRVDVLLPANAEVNVRLRQKVKGKVDIIAVLP
jgi:phosphatidylserine decarboxylase